MSSARYERLPTTEEPSSPPAYELEDGRPRPPTFPVDPRFHQPTPSPLSRAALLIFLAFMFWLAFHMRQAGWIGLLE
ncbi:hypothetical protein D9615_004791 [Tricholomella constricta]|uniref:Uncharacterized protein n=1 Tax=Tricholomella constricta TaxID=117010 RepID=A0A8H5M6Z0_9AGAR|nr:hypothetical protein D9615_004791 [Tricholomella constricta]